MCGKVKVYLLDSDLNTHIHLQWGFPGGASGKDPPANAGDAGEAGSIRGLGRSPGGGHSTPLQGSCLGNPMDRGAWWAAVHSVAKSWTRLSDLARMHTHFYTLGTYILKPT